MVPSTSEIYENGKQTVTYVAKAVDPYVPTAAKDAAGYVLNTATSITGSVYQTAAAAQTFATQKATEAVEFGKGVVVGAGATVQKYTPDPVMSLLNNAMTSAQALRTDPVATVNAAVKPYVPSFVVQVGEKTYEVVQHTADSAKRTATETSGFIVTKVNGTVDYITHIPQVESLITELHKLVPASTKSTNTTTPAAASSKSE